MNKNVIIDEFGLLTFPDLSDIGVKNACTYDGSKWGNLNPTFAKTEEEKQIIKEKDLELAKILGYTNLVLLTTPPEDTFGIFDKISYKYLKGISTKDNLELSEIIYRGNAVIIEKFEGLSNIGFLIAPRDCAVIVIPYENHVVFLHLGLPQLLTGLHTKILSYMDSLYSDNATRKVFVFPYISSKYYFKDEKKIEKFDIDFTIYDRLITKKDDLFYFDFIAQFKADINKLGIYEVFESDICTYESAKEGNLFSKTFTDEMASKENNMRLGNHNVIISF